MIQLLEVIVAMEKLKDIDVEGNGIDLGEMFEINDKGDFIVDSEGYVIWKAGMQTAAEEILSMANDLGEDSDLYKALDNVNINGISLRKMLTDAKEGAKLTEKEAKLYHASLAALYKAMLSGDYNEEEIAASMKEVLSGTGYEGEIDVGDWHLTLKHGYVLERDSEGKFIVDGKKFEDEDTALKAQAAITLDGLLGDKKDINLDTGAVTYHGAIDATVEVDITEDQVTYTAHVEDYTVTSTTKEGIAAAIKTASMLSGKEWTDTATNAEDENNTLTYTMKYKASAVVDMEVDVETGKVNYKPENFFTSKPDADTMHLLSDIH
jgi:hypothetical protein